MNKTKIEWCDYTINPVKGLCPVACPYCYARRLYKRFKWNPEIRFDISVFDKCGYLEVCHSDPQRIFVGSTMELFGDWIKSEWLEEIFDATSDYPNHRFLFLTKQPQNLIQWSPFPENVYIGVTTTDTYMAVKGLQYLDKIQAKVKFISFEPLLSQTCMTASSLAAIGWVIVGAQTGPYKPPEISWAKEIVDAADKAGIPVFLKENLKPLLQGSGLAPMIEYPWAYRSGQLRQEVPNA
jgi:protein gp37